MIKDLAKKTEIVRDWEAVKKLCAGSHRQYQSSRGYINETPPESFYNLPLVLAYCALDGVLIKLRDQGEFRCTGDFLGDRMKSSKKILPWYNYKLVSAGRIARNALAHKAKLVPKKECLIFINAIENELRAWGIIG